MYVEASALTAILKNEPEREEFLSRIEDADTPITSAVSIFEAVIALSTLTGSCASANREVTRFLDRAQIQIEPIDASHLNELALARDRFGKGTGHPAQLNLGDCFSYAVAKTAGVPLLFKGNDFVHTDLV